MATYGVSYGGKKNPSSYGARGARSLSSLYGTTSMQPVSSVSRPSLASTFQPISDVLNSAQVANRQRLSAIAPQTTTDAAEAWRLANGGAPAASAPAGQSTADAAAAWRLANPSGTATPPPAGSTGTDLSADPILTQIKALGLKSAQDAESGLLSTAKNRLINYGATDVPQSLRDLFAAGVPTNDSILGDLGANPILGALNDPGTAAAAAANPFSTVKQLSGAHDANVHNLDQASNLANLFYSSTHANQLGDENQAYLGSQNQALQNLGGLLAGDNQGVLGSIDQAHQNYLGELPNAYARALAAGSGDPTVQPPGPTDPNAPPNGDGTAPPTPPPGYGRRTGRLSPTLAYLLANAPAPAGGDYLAKLY